MLTYQKMLEVKDKYSKSYLLIDGIHGIGIKDSEQKIVIYVHKPVNEIDFNFPTMLEEFELEIIEEEKPVAHGLIYESAGYTAGQLTSSRGATLGSWWYSTKLNKPVLISNNHVLSQTNNAIKRMFSNTIPFLYEIGGQQTTNLDINDKRTYFNPYGDWHKNHEFWYKMHYPKLESVTPSNAKAGDIVTIKGKNLGHRKGWSNVLFGDKKATIKSWNYSFVPNANCCTMGAVGKFNGSVSMTVNGQSYNTGTKINYNAYQYQCSHFLLADCTIEAYVPLDAGNSLQIEVEGDEIDWVDWDTLHYIEQIAQVEDYFPINANYAENNTTFPGRDKTAFGAFCDVGMASATEPKWVTRDIKKRLGYDANVLAKTKEYYELGESYKIKGIYNSPIRQNMILKKTGMMGGTSYGYVETISTDLTISYPYRKWNSYSELEINIDRTIKDIIKIRGIDVSIAGDSGSSWVTATLDEYNRFYDYYAPTSTERCMNPLTDIEPNLFIGNNFGGNPTSPYNFAYCDRATYWIDAFGLVPLDAVPFVDYMEANNTATIQANVEVIMPPIEIMANLSSQSIVNGEVFAITIKTIEPFNLVSVSSQPQSDVAFNLQLIGDYYNLLANYVSSSTFDVTFSMVAPLDIVCHIESTSTIKVITDLFIAFNINSISSVDVNVNTPLSPIDIIGIRADSNSTMIIVPTIQLENNSSIQYENLSLSITRYINLKLTI